MSSKYQFCTATLFVLEHLQSQTQAEALSHEIVAARPTTMEATKSGTSSTEINAP
jgi:hypothetical protein